MTYLAFQNALAESGWGAQELATCGFLFASTTSQIDLWENDLPDYKNPNIDPSKIESAIFNQSLGSPMISLAHHFNMKGPKSVIASSCSAGLQALSMAYHWIKYGQVERCIVGSTEILSDLTTLGFQSLRLVSKIPSKPFSKNRNGINLGEGSGFIFLEKQSLPKRKPSQGLISGAGFNLDAYHATSPHPEGRGSLLSLQKAIEEAKLKPADIGWIYAHGTGSPANDLSESIAIRNFFAGNSCPPITSTKSIHGHTLAASGVIETILGVMAMNRGQVLPTFNDQVSDPQIPLDVTPKVLQKSYQHFIKNSLGFGGVNAAVVISRSGSGL